MLDETIADLNDSTAAWFFEDDDDLRSEEIDEKVVGKVVELGFDREFIRKSLRIGETNHATTCYFLLKDEESWYVTSCKYIL